jgi:hypothetical protein
MLILYSIADQSIITDDFYPSRRLLKSSVKNKKAGGTVFSSINLNFPKSTLVSSNRSLQDDFVESN